MGDASSDVHDGFENSSDHPRNSQPLPQTACAAIKKFLVKVKVCKVCKGKSTDPNPTMTVNAPDRSHQLHRALIEWDEMGDVLKDGWGGGGDYIIIVLPQTSDASFFI